MSEETGVCGCMGCKHRDEVLSKECYDCVSGVKDNYEPTNKGEENECVRRT